MNVSCAGSYINLPSKMKAKSWRKQQICTSKYRRWRRVASCSLSLSYFVGRPAHFPISQSRSRLYFYFCFALQVEVTVFFIFFCLFLTFFALRNSKTRVPFVGGSTITCSAARSGKFLRRPSAWIGWKPLTVPGGHSKYVPEGRSKHGAKWECRGTKCGSQWKKTTCQVLVRQVFRWAFGGGDPMT